MQAVEVDRKDLDADGARVAGGTLQLAELAAELSDLPGVRFCATGRDPPDE